MLAPVDVAATRDRVAVRVRALGGRGVGQLGPRRREREELLQELAREAGRSRSPGLPSRVSHPLQHRDLVDLRRLEVVPEDAARAVVDALDVDRRARGDDQVDREVVVGHHQVLAQDLDRVDGRRDDRVRRRSCPPRSAARTRGPRSRRPCRPARRSG